jgi:predicted DNA-binding protein
MIEYVTTNIRLPKAMHEQLKQLALDKNESLAQIVRESLVEYLTSPRADDSSNAAETMDDPLFHITELTRPEDVNWGDRPTDTSIRHDYYLYGVDTDRSPARGKPNE